MSWYEVKEHVEEDIKLIIVVNSERVIGEKILREASQSFVKTGKDESSRKNAKRREDFYRMITLSVICSMRL